MGEAGTDRLTLGWRERVSLPKLGRTALKGRCLVDSARDRRVGHKPETDS